MELVRRRLLRIALGILGIATALGAARLVLGGDRSGGPSGAAASEPILVVEVLNGTGRSGLARQVTRLLREQGVDVVYFGTAGEKRDSTVVLVRRGDAARGHQVARMLGTRTVTVKPDSKRRVDLSVILGADYRLPKDRLPL